ncbi:hypothetical protein [Microvirus mar63]|uniref:Uncharacterized protein n=1 Tax=Microvirus mar63 TaxID=2851200 RepID=A0A8F5RBX6_9VIRU|nr:hypothetical protein [Microvirus mar63]
MKPEKMYLVSIQSKSNQNNHETILVRAEEIASFIEASLSADKVIIVSMCAVFEKQAQE